MGPSGAFWQNVVHWRREWQTTAAFLPREPHEQHEKAKWYNGARWAPRSENVQYARGAESEGQLLRAPERMKLLDQSRNDDAQLWTCQWTWIWANSGRYWGTGRPGMLQSTGSQRVGHNLVTEQQNGNSLSSGIIILFSTTAALLYIHTAAHKCSKFSTSLLTLVIFI